LFRFIPYAAFNPRSKEKTALVWLITGPSSGFRHEFVKQILARGDKVIATTRSLSKIQHLKETGADIMTLDVTFPQATLDAIAAEAIQQEYLLSYQHHQGFSALVPRPGLRYCGYYWFHVGMGNISWH
jgi:D-arabinose 1-dehydrogenase-like Zn-dependent alcohol dehydrogenase